MSESSTKGLPEEDISGLGVQSVGIDYQLKVGCLLMLRGLRHKLDFVLDIEKSDAGNFDDVVFSYSENGEKVQYFIQLSRGRVAGSNLDKKIRGYMLLRRPHKKINKLHKKVYLKSFLQSFQEINKQKRYKDKGLKKFIFYTAMDLEFSDENSTNTKRQTKFKLDKKDVILEWEEISNKNCILSSSSPQGPNHTKPCYKIFYNEAMTGMGESPDAVKEFLQEFYFYTNHPTESEFDDLLVNEISEIKPYGKEMCCDVCHELMEYCRNQLKHNRSFKITPSIANEILLKRETQVLKQKLNAYSENDCFCVNPEEITFKNSFKPLKTFLDQNNDVFWNIACSHEPSLSFISLQETLCELQKDSPYNSWFIFKSRMILLRNQSVKDDFVSVFSSNESSVILLLLQGEKLEEYQISFLQEVYDVLYREKDNDSLTKKLVIISHENHQNSLKTIFGELYKYDRGEAITLKSLTANCQEKLLRSEIIFQGRLLPLESLIGTDYSYLVDERILSKLITTEKPIKIGNPVPSIEFFKPALIRRRLLRRNVVRQECLNSNGGNVFALSGSVHKVGQWLNGKEVIGVSKLNEESNLTDRNVFILDEGPTKSFLKLCEKFPSRSVHWMHIRNECMFLVRSHNSIATIKSYLDPTSENYVITNIDITTDLKTQKSSDLQVFIQGISCYQKTSFIWEQHSSSEDKTFPNSDDNEWLGLRELILYKLDKNRYPRIISGESGMGKTTLLKLVCFQRKMLGSDHWVLYVNAQDLVEELREIKDNCDNVDEIHFLKKCQHLTNTFQENLFEYLYETKGTTIAIDDFDRLPGDCRKTLSKILKKISDHGSVALWVSTKSCCKEELESSLSVIAYELDALSETEQRDYLEMLSEYELRISCVSDKLDDNVKSFIFDLLCSVSSTDSSLTRSPLILQMLVEICKGQLYCKECPTVSFETCLDICEIFETFLDNIYSIFLKKKCSKNFREYSEVNPTWLSLWANNVHASKSVQLIFPNEDIQDICKRYFWYDTLKDQDEQDLLNIGIIQGCQDPVKFLHHSFAEFFVAIAVERVLLIGTEECKRKIKSFLKKIIPNKAFELLRRFLDLKLSRDRPIHEAAILNLTPASLDELRDNVDSNIGPCKKPIRKAATLNLTTMNLDEVNSSDILGRTPMHLSVLYKSMDFLMFLLEKFQVDFDVEDVFNKTPILYAIENGDWETVALLIFKGNNIEYSGIKTEGKIQLLEAACESGFNQVVKTVFINSSSLEVENYLFSEALANATKEEHVDVVKTIVEYAESIPLVDVVLYGQYYYFRKDKEEYEKKGGTASVIGLVTETDESWTNISSLILRPGRNYISPILLAVQNGNITILEYFIELIKMSRRDPCIIFLLPSLPVIREAMRNNQFQVFEYFVTLLTQENEARPIYELEYRNFHMT